LVDQHDNNNWFPEPEDDDNNNWFPEPDYVEEDDTLLADYDELVRSVYVETAAERDSSQEDDENDGRLLYKSTTTIEEECPIPESSMRFFREFSVDDDLLSLHDFSSVTSSSEDHSPFGIVYQRRRHHRRRNISLHPLREEVESLNESSPISMNPSPQSSYHGSGGGDHPLPTSSTDIMPPPSSSLTCETTPTTAVPADASSLLLPDQPGAAAEDLPTPTSHSSTETTSSSDSSPCCVLPPKRRRCSLFQVGMPSSTRPTPSSRRQVVDDDDSTSVSSSSEESSSGGSDDSEGQATVIAEEKGEALLLGGLPIHNGHTILTAVPETRPGLDVDMVEHRRLAIECHLLRNRLTQAWTEKQDMNRDYQRLLVIHPKLQQQLIDSCNEVSIINLFHLHRCGLRLLSLHLIQNDCAFFTPQQQ
jgi:hypothetical protein